MAKSIIYIFGYPKIWINKINRKIWKLCKIYRVSEVRKLRNSCSNQQEVEKKKKKSYLLLYMITKVSGSFESIWLDPTSKIKTYINSQWTEMKIIRRKIKFHK